MAKILPTYVSSTGDSYENSYWRLVSFSVDLDAKWTEFNFKGWRSKTAREKFQAEIGKFSFTVSGDEFIFYYSKYLTGEINISQIAYQSSSNKYTQVRSLDENEDIKTENKILFDDSAQDDI